MLASARESDLLRQVFERNAELGLALLGSRGSDWACCWDVLGSRLAKEDGLLITEGSHGRHTERVARLRGPARRTHGGGRAFEDLASWKRPARAVSGLH